MAGPGDGKGSDVSAGVTIEVSPVEGIDLGAAIPCEYRPAGGAGPVCGKPSAARVRVARNCCGIHNLFFICAEDFAKAKLPMILPAQADDPAATMQTLARAWELTEWEPVSALTAGRIRDMITAWTTAYELAVLCDESGPAPWRLRGMEDRLGYVRAMRQNVLRELNDLKGTGLPDPE